MSLFEVELFTHVAIKSIEQFITIALKSHEQKLWSFSLMKNMLLIILLSVSQQWTAHWITIKSIVLSVVECWHVHDYLWMICQILSNHFSISRLLIFIEMVVKYMFTARALFSGHFAKLSTTFTLLLANSLGFVQKLYDCLYKTFQLFQQMAPQSLPQKNTHFAQNYFGVFLMIHEFTDPMYWKPGS